MSRKGSFRSVRKWSQGWDRASFFALIQFSGSGVDGKSAEPEVLRSSRHTYGHTHTGTSKQSHQCGRWSSSP